MKFPSPTGRPQGRSCPLVSSLQHGLRVGHGNEGETWPHPNSTSPQAQHDLTCPDIREAVDRGDLREVAMEGATALRHTVICTSRKHTLISY